jgi:hypothetical protein
MLIQNYIVSAAKQVISASFASGSITNWQIYGQYDVLDRKGIEFTNVRVQCFDEQPYEKALKTGLHKAQLELLTSAIRLTDTGEGTTANEFETVSDLVFNPFLMNGIEGIMGSYTPNIIYKLVIEDGLETTPLTDGWIASQKLEVTCARTS